MAKITAEIFQTSTEDWHVQIALNDDGSAWSEKPTSGIEYITTTRSMPKQNAADLAARINQPQIDVEKVADLLIRADGYLSLIAHRYCRTAIPDDLQRDLLTTSGECRVCADALRKAMEGAKK